MYCDLENTYLFPRKKKIKRCGFDLQAVSSIKVSKYSSHTFTHFFPQMEVVFFRISLFLPFYKVQTYFLRFSNYKLKRQVIYIILNTQK